MIQENVHSLAGFGVKPILGKAPDSLLDLPDPDRVFVGGSGGMLKEILQIVEERLKPEGRVVVSIVTPETLGRVQDWLQKTSLAHKCRLLQVSRTVPIQPSSDRGERAFLSRFQPQTPLFLLSLWKA